MDKQHVEPLSMQLFGIGVKALNKLQASGLIDELISQQENGNGTPQPAMAGGQEDKDDCLPSAINSVGGTVIPTQKTTTD